MQRKKTPADKIVESKDFEKSLKRLEAIVEQLEAGKLALDQALQLFEEGQKLGAGCMNYLTEIERQLLKVIDDEPRAATVEPFTVEEES